MVYNVNSQRKFHYSSIPIRSYDHLYNNLRKIWGHALYIEKKTLFINSLWTKRCQYHENKSTILQNLLNSPEPVGRLNQTPRVKEIQIYTNEES